MGIQKVCRMGVRPGVDNIIILSCIRMKSQLSIADIMLDAVVSFPKEKAMKRLCDATSSARASYII